MKTLARLVCTGGGWMNGRGDEGMNFLVDYRRVYDFVTSFDWWTTEPHDELVTARAYCLASAGSIYAVYLPTGGIVIVKLDPGKYRAEWYDPLTGERLSMPDTEGSC